MSAANRKSGLQISIKITNLYIIHIYKQEDRSVIMDEAEVFHKINRNTNYKVGIVREHSKRQGSVLVYMESLMVKLENLKSSRL